MTQSLELLLVDASRPARYALRLMLQRHGMRVRTAESAEQALRLIRDDAPDAVLTACVLPGMNGLELLELLRTDPSTVNVPVVICCPDDRWPLEQSALRRGAIAILRRDRADLELPVILERIEAALTATPLPAPPTSTPEPTPTSGPLVKLTEAFRRIWQHWHHRSHPVMIAAVFAGAGLTLLNLIFHRV